MYTRLTVLLLACSLAAAAAAVTRPNVVVILADDLGYGDLGCYQPESKIPTPHLDRLARDGVRFTDAHTPSAVCTPTRYGLLTGRYAWRTWLKSGVLDGFDPPLLEDGRLTVASFLQRHGYTTACIGKWHLGMTWRDRNGQPVPYRGAGAGGFRAGAEVDYARPTSGGPLDRGFDVFYGISASLDMSPYAMIEGRRAVGDVSVPTPEKRDLYLNQVAGMTTREFTLEGVLPALTERAIAFVHAQAEERKPFFLYFPLPSPHLPVVPNQAWKGKSGAGLYGDFVMETDAAVGELMTALDRAGVRDNTLVIFTSDNGGLWHGWTPRERDDLAGYQPTARAKYAGERGHRSNASLRGTKADIYEGGHRVPFIARWPARVPAGRTSEALIELNDLFATVAEVLGQKLPADAAEDSFSFLAALTGGAAGSPARTFGVHHSLSGVFAWREGPWKFVPSRGSGGFSQPRVVTPEAGEPPGQLYHLGRDPQETRNVWAEHPDVVERLSAKLDALRAGDRSR